jgi:hypothetical protein
MGWIAAEPENPKEFPGAEGGDLNKRHSWEAAQQCNKFDALWGEGGEAPFANRTLGEVHEPKPWIASRRRACNFF